MFKKNKTENLNIGENKKLEKFWRKTKLKNRILQKIRIEKVL